MAVAITWVCVVWKELESDSKASTKDIMCSTRKSGYSFKVKVWILDCNLRHIILVSVSLLLKQDTILKFTLMFNTLLNFLRYRYRQLNVLFQKECSFSLNYCIMQS